MAGTQPIRRPLVLTGGPAVGKTTCARTLADMRPRATVIDVDDIRQLVVSGAAAPWEGPAGQEQLILAARNASSLAVHFVGAGFDPVIADVLTPTSAEVYRQRLPDCLIVHLRVSLAEARRRAATRKVFLTESEFEWLHDRDARQPPSADVVLRVDGWSISRQVAELETVWAAGRSSTSLTQSPCDGG